MSPPVPGRKSLVQSIKDLPGVRSLREARFARAFRQAGGGLHYGVFPTFQAAQRAAPANLGVGFNRSSLTRVYDYRMEHAMPSDYPVLFWLAKILTPTARIFDYGGHIGISFHCFQRYLGYPPGLAWRVCDVPTIIEEGARLAKERGATQLSFTTAFTEVDGADILLALGSLQFIEQDLWALLSRISKKPRHILVSKIPLYEGPTFFTSRTRATRSTPIGSPTGRSSSLG